jgi:hypothetical protein
METQNITREQHEQRLVRAFILPQRQGRYIELLSKPRRRIDVLNELSHFKHLDPRWTREIPKQFHSALQIAEFLRSKGAPNLCWAISEDEHLDSKETPLAEAIGYIFGTWYRNLFVMHSGQARLF